MNSWVEKDNLLTLIHFTTMINQMIMTYTNYSSWYNVYSSVCVCVGRNRVHTGNPSIGLSDHLIMPMLGIKPII